MFLGSFYYTLGTKDIGRFDSKFIFPLSIYTEGTCEDFLDDLLFEVS